MNPNILKLINSRREELYNTVKDINIDLLHWRPFQDSVSISSSLLHIAGFEFLVINSMVNGTCFSIFSSKGWDIYKKGFFREFHDQTPSEGDIEYYLNLLKANRQKILRHIKASNMENKYICYYDQNDFFKKNENGQFIEPTQVDTKYLLSNEEMTVRLSQHDNYHRGQISFLKYLYGKRN